MKAIAALGIILSLIGTILLWVGSPSGYPPPAYMNIELINRLRKNNGLMRIKQKTAISLMTVGAFFQIFAVVYSD